MSEPATKIDFASLISADTGIVELAQDWEGEGAPPLFYAPGKTPLQNLQPASPLVYAEESGYYIEEGRITFVLRPGRYDEIEWEGRTLFVAGDFNGWSAAIRDAAWQMMEKVIDGVRYYVLNLHCDQCLHRGWGRFKFVTNDHQWLEVPSAAPNVSHDDKGRRNFNVDARRTGRHVFTFSIPEGLGDNGQTEILWAGDDYEETVPLLPGDYFLRAGSDLPLGALVEVNRTVFRLFAPRAGGVTLTYFNDLEKRNGQKVEMQLNGSVVWEAIVEENLHGWYYHYNVSGDPAKPHTGFEPGFDILDPYALAAVGAAGPGIVWDKSFTPPRKTAFKPQWWHDLVIMETHVRDLNALAPAPMTEEERLGFTGLRKWVQSEDFYLSDLGVNAIELQPIQQFDGGDPETYHWGYMPVNYFSPAAAYALDPARGSQIREFQELVSACHHKGLAVIVDVVYNHFGLPNHLERIDKHYYFELDHDGSYINWSGTGNTLRCDSAMARRMIIESLAHFLEYYDVDGFRFDLAELIGVEVLEEIETALKKVKPAVILIAEPWSFRGHIIHALKDTGFASWNDGFREHVREYIMGRGNVEGICYYLSGSPGHHTAWPAQTVNYVASHDDRCWLDNITENPDHNGSEPTANDRRRTHLMAALLMTSLGIPMLSAGQDLLHSKQGVNNTYLRGDLNVIDYNRARRFPATREYFRRWIKFRLSDQGRILRLDSRPSDNYLNFFHASGSTAVAALYNADFSHGEHRLLFAVNPHSQAVKIPLQDLDAAGWLQIADHERFDPQGLESPLFSLDKQTLHLPPMSCGLWLE